MHQVKYSKLVHSGATQTGLRERLVGGNMTAIAMCNPNNSKATGVGSARFRGMSFPAFMSSCVISESSRRA